MPQEILIEEESTTEELEEFDSSEIEEEAKDDSVSMQHPNNRNTESFFELEDGNVTSQQSMDKFDQFNKKKIECEYAFTSGPLARLGEISQKNKKKLEDLVQLQIQHEQSEIEAKKQEPSSNTSLIIAITISLIVLLISYKQSKKYLLALKKTNYG